MTTQDKTVTAETEEETEELYEFEFRVHPNKAISNMVKELKAPADSNVQVTIRMYASEADALDFAAKAGKPGRNPQETIRSSFCTEHADPVISVESALEQLAEERKEETDTEYKPKDILELPFKVFAELALLCDDAHWESYGRNTRLNPQEPEKNGISISELIHPTEGQE